MKFIRCKGLLLESATACLMVVLFASSSEASKHWIGYLVDAKSAELYKSLAPGHAFDSATRYSRDTATSKESIKAGYVIHADHHWYQLDTHGNELAVKALNRSIKKTGFLVSVNGNLKGNIIETTNLVEMVGTPHRTTKLHILEKTADHSHKTATHH